MKQTAVAIFVAFVSTTSLARTLEEAYSSQVVETISPVKFNGHGISTELPYRGHGNPSEAAAICSSLGYTRLVDYKIENCSVNEVLAVVSSVGNVLAFTSEYKCSSGENQFGRIGSVTCAR